MKESDKKPKSSSSAGQGSSKAAKSPVCKVFPIHVEPKKPKSNTSGGASTASSKAAKSPAGKVLESSKPVHETQGTKPASVKTNRSTKTKSPPPVRARRNTMAKLLCAGPGLLQRAQQADKTLNGFSVTSGEVTKLLTIAEQCEKANDPRTPFKIRVLLLDPYNQLSIIGEYLGLTGVGGLVVERLRQFNHPIRCFINVSYEAPLFKLDGIEAYRIPVVDDKSEDISIYFDEVTDKLEKVRLTGSVSIVHCMAGVSRSASFVIAYLMRYQNKSLEQAFCHVKHCRSVAAPNIGFLAQLGQYERKWRSESDWTRWLDHTHSAVTKSLPEFVIKDYFEDYQLEFGHNTNCQ